MKTVLHWVILGLGLVLIFNMSRSISDLVKRGEVVQEAEDALAQAQAEHESLKQELTYVQSPEFIEEQAREKLNMSRIGDVVIIPPEVPPPPEEEPEDTRKPWQKWKDTFRL